MKEFIPEHASTWLAGVSAFLLGIVGWFMKREHRRLDEHHTRINSLEQDTAKRADIETLRSETHDDLESLRKELNEGLSEIRHSQIATTENAHNMIEQAIARSEKRVLDDIRELRSWMMKDK